MMARQVFPGIPRIGLIHLADFSWIHLRAQAISPPLAKVVGGDWTRPARETVRDWISSPNFRELFLGTTDLFATHGKFKSPVGAEYVLDAQHGPYLVSGISVGDYADCSLSRLNDSVRKLINESRAREEDETKLRHAAELWSEFIEPFEDRHCACFELKLDLESDGVRGAFNLCEQFAEFLIVDKRENSVFEIVVSDD